MKFKPMKIKTIDIKLKLDTDNDKVMDFKDCRPFNPKKQHIRPSRTMRKRLNKLPIYVTDEEMTELSTRVIPDDPLREIPWEEPKTYHILSKEAKRKAPKARTEMLSSIKKYPSIVGEIEKSKPLRVYHSSKPKGTAGGRYCVDDKVILLPTPEDLPFYKTKIKEIEYDDKHWEAGTSPEIRKEVTKTRLDLWPYESETKITKRRKNPKRIASSLHHEGKHHQQFTNASDEDLEIMVTQDDMYGYYSKPIEVEARAYAREQLDKYKKRKPTGKQISKTLQLDDEYEEDIFEEEEDGEE